MKSKTLFFFSFVIAAAIFLYLYFDGAFEQSDDNEPAFHESDTTQSFTPDSRSVFYSIGDDKYFYCTKDGLSYISSNGNTEWLSNNTFAEPELIGEGKFVAIGEPGGNLIAVYNNAGEVYRKLFENSTILYFSINKLGYLSAILKKDNSYETLVFNESGNQIWQMTHLVANVYPVTADISQDGRIIALNLLDLRDLSVVSELVFCFLNSDEAKGYTDTIFGSKIKKEQVIAAISFLDDGTLVSISDVEVCGISFSKTNEINYDWSIPLNNTLDCIGFSDYSFVLVYGNGIVNKQPEPSGTIHFYDSKGKLTGDYKLEKSPNFLTYSRNNCIVTVGKNVYAINDKGKLLWEYNGLQQINQAFWLNFRDNLLVVTENSATILKKG